MKKLFANDKFYLGVFLISIISLFTILIIKATQSGGDFLHYDWFLVVIYFVCELAMFISYKNHNKNVMKGMIGATLMAIVQYGLYSATIGQSTGAIACAIFYTILGILLFITHFIINSDHHSNPESIKTNIAFCIIFAIINVAWFIVDINNIGFNITSLLYMLANIGIATTVVCIEAKLDSHRLDREAAGWSEDKGYPEGYVHQFEKKKK